MKFGESVLVSDDEGKVVSSDIEAITDEDAISNDMLAYISKVSINKQIFHTFDDLEVDVEYTILDDKIDGFLLGVAIYSKDRKNYIFGPNTYLDKKKLAGKKGKYVMKYTVPKMALISGEYSVDVGIFNNEGIINLDYKMDVVNFAVSNQYFSEGMFYMEHSWDEREE